MLLNLHGCDGSSWARSSLEGGEGSGSASSLDIGLGLASGENSCVDLGGRRNRDNFRAVNQGVSVLSKDGELSHGSLELRDHELVVR